MSSLLAPNQYLGRRAMIGASLALAVLVTVLALSVLAGWALDMPALKSVQPGWVSMKANTALGLLGVAGIVAALASARRRWAVGLSAALAVLGAASVAQDLLGVSLGLDELLFRDAGEAPLTGAPGRMAPNTALSFLLLGLGGWALAGGPRRALFGQVCCGAVLLLSLMGTLGYAYGVETLYSVERHTAMALHTSVGLFVGSAGMLLARPGLGAMRQLLSPDAGGALSRRLLPVALAAPVVLDLLLMIAASHGMFGPAFAAALHTALMTVGLVVLVGVTARTLDRQDAARREAAEALLQQERQYRELFENMEAGFAVHRMVYDDRGEPADYVFEDVNDEFVALTGLERERIVGVRVTEVLPGIERDPADWIGRYGRVAKTGEPTRFEQHSELLSRWYSVLVYRPRPDHFATIFTDVTERRRREDHIHHLNARLRKQTAQLAETNEWLESFNYSVSHDLRAPLRAIDGFSEAILEDYADQLPDQARRYLDRVRAGAQRMGKLIDDLLQLSRVGRAELALEPMDLSHCTREVFEELEETEPERRVELTLEGDLTVQADPRLARMLVANLVGNAWKFTRHQPQPRIEVGSEEAEGERHFYVRDNGAGFDPQYAHKLFRVFQRLHTDEDFAGTGIGLATVQRIARRHGGRVWAEGAPGEGATIWFTLAHSAGEEGDAERELPAVSAEGGREA